MCLLQADFWITNRLENLKSHFKDDHPIVLFVFILKTFRVPVWLIMQRIGRPPDY